MMNKHISKFIGPYRFLSNFYICLVPYEGIDYPSAEHAYQAAKSDDKDIRLLISTASSPGYAKGLGKHVYLRKDWEDVKLDVMESIVYSKFDRNEYLQNKLLETGDAILIEGNNWGDKFWGVCDGEGENHLGLILMKVRSKFLDYRKHLIR